MTDKTNLFFDKNKKIFLLSAIIVILAIIPRSVELLNGNYLFGFDQGLFFERVRDMVVNKKLRLIGEEVGGQGGFFQGPGWYYLLSIPFIIFRGNPYGTMVLMMLMGMGVVLLAILATKEMFGWKEALFVGFLTAVSPALIAQSRFIWNPFPISLLSVFLILFLYKVLEKKEKFLPLLIFTVGIMFHFEVASAATLLVQLIILSPLLIVNKLVSPRFFFLSLLVIFFPLSPLIIFDLRHDFIITKGVVRLFAGQPFSHQVTLQYIKAMFLNHLDVFRFNFLSTFQLNSKLWPLLIIILVLGSMLYLKKKREPFAKRAIVFYLAVSPLILFLVFMFYQWPMWEWWLLELCIFYCFLLGIIFGHLWKRPALKPIIAFLVFIFISSFVNRTVGFYRNDFYDYGGTHKIRGKIEVLDKIYKDAGGKEFGLLVFTPPIYTYPYDYLLWWHGQRAYNYLPHKEKKGLFYLLIEPDPSQPWSYKGWLETVIKTGKVLKEEKLPSGFIIQKRYEKEI